MNIVNEVIHPHAARVLINAHSPIRDYFNRGIGVEFGDFNQRLSSLMPVSLLTLWHHTAQQILRTLQN